eukprot:GEMP01093847.1.p1 GENE.GEMP01093847.1~~GEMP01093847.1.p1  ORF type:complete len:159 (+),score=45.43 GEMP01093847.1:136-612(+)
MLIALVREVWSVLFQNVPLWDPPAASTPADTIVTSDAPLETLSGLQGANTSESATLYRRPYSTYSAQHQAHVCSHAHAAAALQQQYDSSVHQFCQWQQAALARQWTEQSSNLAPYEAWEEEPTDCGAKTEVNSSPPFMGLFPSAFDVKGKNNLFFYSG